jgi:hypothetical protein
MEEQPTPVVHGALAASKASGFSPGGDADSSFWWKVLAGVLVVAVTACLTTWLKARRARREGTDPRSLESRHRNLETEVEQLSTMVQVIDGGKIAQLAGCVNELGTRLQHISEAVERDLETKNAKIKAIDSHLDAQMAQVFDGLEYVHRIIDQGENSIRALEETKRSHVVHVGKELARLHCLVDSLSRKVYDLEYLAMSPVENHGDHSDDQSNTANSPEQADDFNEGRRLADEDNEVRQDPKAKPRPPPRGVSGEKLSGNGHVQCRGTTEPDAEQFRDMDRVAAMTDEEFSQFDETSEEEFRIFKRDCDRALEEVTADLGEAARGDSDRDD